MTCTCQSPTCGQQHMDYPAWADRVVTADVGRADRPWAEVEALMPKGWHLELSWPSERDGEWRALASGSGVQLIGYGPTPAAAVLALDAALRDKA